GSVRLPGWMNIDRFDSDLDLDLSFPLPFPNESCTHIYHEHFLEHLPRPVADSVLQECRRVLVGSGVMRIAIPDLGRIIADYVTGDWRKNAWLKRGDYHADTAAEALNMSFRWWGHEWLYDFEELERYARAAGFSRVVRAARGLSEDPVLSGLETRDDSYL